MGLRSDFSGNSSFLEKNNPPKLLKSAHVLSSLGEVGCEEPLACIATGVFPLLYHLPLDNRGQGP